MTEHSDGLVLYKERTWAPPWVWVLLWGACLVAVAAAASDQELSGAARTAIIAGVLLFPLLITAVFGCLDIRVRADRLSIAFGPLHLIRKTIRFPDIESVKAVTYRPIREFGGWGIRFRARKSAWTVRGNRAVSVRRRSGKEIYAGSANAQRLAEQIRAALKAWQANTHRAHGQGRSDG